MSIWEALIDEYKKTKKVTDSLRIATLAQWVVESGRGSSELAEEHLNFGGLKFRQRMANIAEPVDYTGSDGVEDTYCKFSSISDFIQGYWVFINKGPYEGWEEHETDGAAYLRHIRDAGYAEDQDYVFKVVSRFSEARALLFKDAESANSDKENLKKVAVVIGHNATQKGAFAPNPLAISEFPYNTKVAHLMERVAPEYGLSAKTFERKHVGSYRKEIDTVYRKVKEWGPECAIELHFNSVNSKKPAGSEVLYRSDNTAIRSYAQNVQNEILDTLGVKDRKVKPTKPNANGGRSLHALNSVPTILVEPFFGSNSKDNATAAAAGEEALARAYLRGIRDYL